LDIKHFLVYSSFLNYGFSLYPLISGYNSSITYCVSYIIIYSFTTFFLILLLDLLTNSTYSIYQLINAHKLYPIQSIFLIIIVASLAGLPPFIGFFLKVAVLLEIFKLTGYILGIIFIFLILISSLGYIRIVKYIYSSNISNLRNDLNFIGLELINKITSSIFSYLFFLISIIFILFNIFFGLPLLIYCDLNALNVFNTFVFDSINSFYTGSFIEKPLFDKLYHYHNIELDNFSDKINNIISDNQFVENYLNHSTQIYIEKHKVLTGNIPSNDDCITYKKFLLENLKLKSSLYTHGSGLEYTKYITKNN
jgi:NADH:ubiquinone oxidoreductase subunit 5 (subunit L)/multisubunit Na+/H+ antiporter MnhA subunit